MYKERIKKTNFTKSIKKRKILYVEQNQDNTVGGSHYCLLYLIKFLNKQKYEPTVMFYESNCLIEKFENEKCKTVVFEVPPSINLNPPHAMIKIPYIIARKVYNVFKTSIVPFVRIILFIKENNIDMVHLNNSATDGLQWLSACKLLGKKCITHERGIEKFNWYKKFQAHYFDKIICMSKAIQNSLALMGIRKNVVMIYDGMNPDEFKNRIRKSSAEIKHEFRIKSDTPVIGIVGNFQKWKGQLTVIRALSIIREDYPFLKCLLIGNVSKIYQPDIDYFNEIQNEIKLHSLEEMVVITGYRNDVPDVINILDIMIHSSITPEPFGMVVLEGMSLKKLMIATDIGGPREIIENGHSGILVPPNNPEILAEKVKYYLDKPLLRVEIGKNAHKRVVEKFGTGKFKDAIDDLYQQLFQ